MVLPFVCFFPAGFSLVIMPFMLSARHSGVCGWRGVLMIFMGILRDGVGGYTETAEEGQPPK
jgi:hypothetical protein